MAAGGGQRLHPLTLRTPKCLLPVQGRPLLEHWLRHCARHGVEEVLVNLHAHPEQVREFVGRRPGPPRVRLEYEPRLLGSGGTLRANRDFVDGEDRFLIIYADNLADVDLTALLRCHAEAGAPLTVALFRAPDPRACGVVELDGGGRVQRFEEKPREPFSDLASAGIYAASPALFDFIPDREFSDLGRDVLPRLVGRMHGFRVEGFMMDVGTLQAYEAAQRDWRGWS